MRRRFWSSDVLTGNQTQQRTYERRVRKTKREIAGLEQAGVGFESPTYVNKRLLLGKQQATLKEFADKYQLPRLYEREKAYGVMKQPRALKVRKPAPKPKPVKTGRVSAKAEYKTINATVSEFENDVKARLAQIGTISESEHMAFYAQAAISPAEHKILWNKRTGYIKTSNSYNINACHRLGQKLTPARQKTSDLLDEVIERVILNDQKAFLRMESLENFAEPVLGISKEKLANMTQKEIAEHLKDLDVTDKAFKSVSTDFKRNVFKSERDVMCVIKNKEGTPVFFTDNYEEESEAIFGRGVRAQITDVQAYNIRGDKAPEDTKDTVLRLILEITIG